MKGENDGIMKPFPTLACIVRHTELDGVKHSIELTASSLFEAAVVGINALRVPGWFGRSTLTIEVRGKQPETIHIVSNPELMAWLVRRGRASREAHAPSEVEWNGGSKALTQANGGVSTLNPGAVWKRQGGCGWAV